MSLVVLLFSLACLLFRLYESCICLIFLFTFFPMILINFFLSFCRRVTGEAMRSIRRSDTFDLCQIVDNLVPILLLLTVLGWVSLFILGIYWAICSFFSSVIETWLVGIWWSFVVSSCLGIGSLFEILRVLVKVASTSARTPWNSPFTLFYIGRPIFVILVSENVVCLQWRLWSHLMCGHLL